MTIIYILLAIVFILLLVYISLRNRLIVLKNKVEYANGSVDAMLRQRYDLIPNLVTVVKEYMKYEKSLLEKLIQLRSEVKKQDLTDIEKANINKQLDHTIKTFNVTVENYPLLKADKQFTYLQAALNECEGQIAAARRTYNASILNYNNAIQVFPTNIVASQIGYKLKSMIKYPEIDTDISSKEIIQ